MGLDLQASERLLRLRSVQARVPLSRASIYRKIGRAEFPRPVSLGGRAVAWRESEVDRWIAERILTAGE